MRLKRRNPQSAEDLRKIREALQRKNDVLEQQLRRKLQPEVADRLHNNVERSWIGILHLAGKTADEIAQERGLSVRFVLDELQRCSEC